jgi:hypothetical protein
MLSYCKSKKGPKIGPPSPFSFNVLASKYYDGLRVGGKKGGGSSISDTRCQLLIRDIRHSHKPIKVVVKLVGKPHEIIQHKQTQGGGSSVRKSEAAAAETEMKARNVNRIAALLALKNYSLSLNCLDNIIMNGSSI